MRLHFNGKAYSTSDGNGHHSYNDPYGLFELDDVDPQSILKYTADPHILSMSFEGPLCGCLNFYNEQGADFDNRIINGFLAILDRYGLYYEMGEHWNLSCYPIHDSDTVDKSLQLPKDSVISFRGKDTNPANVPIPEPLLNIQRVWRDSANAYGDVGSCVLGAGFRFQYRDSRYFMPPISMWQGSVSWEHCVGQITDLLKEAGPQTSTLNGAIWTKITTTGEINMDYDTMRSNLKSIDSVLHETLVAKCQENLWLKKGGAPFQDDPCLELDSPYSFVEADDLEILREYFQHGNWSIRQGIVYGDLAFINQINGGDEWWTLKLDRSTGEYIPFESITFRLIIERGEFAEYIGRFERATIEQCKRLKY